jgi:hypothetical protein
MPAYQYPIPKKKAHALERKGTPVREKPPEAQEQVGLINGMKAGSVLEWRVYVALVRFKLVFEYQVPIRGGRRVPGGRVLDFLVYNPFPIPVPVMGKHWHSGKKREDDLMMLNLLRQVYKREPVPLWEDELYSQEATNQLVKEKLM